MPIRVQCPQCSKALTVPDQYAGKRGKCPGCGTAIPIPMPGGASPQAIRTASAPAPTAKQPSREATGTTKAKTRPTAAGGPGPEMFQKLWRLFLLLFIVDFVLGLAAAFFGYQVYDKAQSGQAEFPVTLLIVVLLLGFVAFAQGIIPYILLYKQWALIQDGNARTTPGKAVLLLLIPFFNIYWFFIAVYGLAQDMNTYAEERGMSIRPASANMLLWAFILSFVGCYPIGLILALIGMSHLKNAAVDIATAKQAG